MTTVSAAPASPTPSKGLAGRTSAGVPGDDFAAMLAGLIGAVEPAAVTATVTPGVVTGTVTPDATTAMVTPGAATATGTPDAATGTGPRTLPPALSPTPLHLGAGAGRTGPSAPLAAEGIGVPVQGELPAAAPVPTVPVPPAPVPPAPVSTAPVATVPVSTAPVTTAPVPTVPSPTVPSRTVPSPVPSSVPSSLTAAPLPGADVPPGAGDHAAGLDTVAPSAAASDVDLPTAIEQDLSAGSEQTAGDGTDEGAPMATPSTAPGVPTETSRVAGTPPAEALAAAPLPETRPISAPTPPPPAAPAPPAAVQVVQQLAPVLEGPDGSYTMSLQLYPEELGAVQVEISLRGGEISLVLHASDDVSKELLRASLGELRAQLEATGLSATDVSVGSGAAPEQDEQPKAQRPAIPASVDDSDDSPAPDSAPDPDAALDLRM